MKPPVLFDNQLWLAGPPDHSYRAPPGTSPEPERLEEPCPC
jgi:hypothetical protein